MTSIKLMFAKSNVGIALILDLLASRTTTCFPLTSLHILTAKIVSKQGVFTMILLV